MRSNYPLMCRNRSVARPRQIGSEFFVSRLRAGVMQRFRFHASENARIMYAILHK